MTDEKNEKKSAKVTAKAPKDKDFPKLKTLTYKEMYNIVGKFLQKAIPMKGAKLKIVKGLADRVSSPKPPYIVLQVEDEKTLSTSETRYTDQYKITWSRSQVTIELSFIGNDNAPALQMARAFTVRFNDAWATEQFEQYNNDVFFPLYSDDVRVEPMSLNAEGQFEDTCVVNAHFEYHPELGICANSAKEIVMDVNIVE
ncbi:phage neck terminator protein [Commensalibacter nepenthis]|uniref:Phage neck terminator protein gp12-like domain-containing protein n=1 Tax=Commensalibacter nepenthis TaxID=3043872 RepID=A0ABT6QB30_9PROT|nr:hypothetical protein [Commensalibacter sp. TBRC 10068]MDI2113962.1 hypothetical protein [Commensalibacter sp. TBRC 10068]